MRENLIFHLDIGNLQRFKRRGRRHPPVGVCCKSLIFCGLIFKASQSSKINSQVISDLQQTPTGATSQ